MLIALLMIIAAVIVLTSFVALVFNTSWKNGYKGIVAVSSTLLFFKFMMFCFALAEDPDFLALNYKLLAIFS